MSSWFNNQLDGILFGLWTIVVLVLGTLFLWQVENGLTLKTNILELMPASEQDPVFETSRSAFEGTMGKTVLILLESDTSGNTPNTEQLRTATEEIEQELTASDVFGPVKGFNQTSGRTFFRLYFPHRYRILAPSIRRKLHSNNPIPRLKEHILRNLHNQTTPVSSDVLERDPLLFFPALVRHWSSLNSPDTGRNRQNTKATPARNMLIARLERDPMATSTQKTVQRIIDRCEKRISNRHPEIQFRWTGLVRLAKVSRNRMQNDASFIGTISLVGVLLLVFFAFQSFRHLFLLAGTVLIGLLSAFTVSQMIFDLHVVTIAFGATLIGISVDYAFHYFCNYRFRPAGWTAWAGLKQIFPGITFGLITSVVAFASLSFTPLPALRQIAFFTSVGLTGAYLTVVAWFPFLFRWIDAGDPSPQDASSGNNPFLLIVDGLLSAWKKLRGGTVSYYLVVPATILIAVILISGLSVLTFDDNVENLAQIPDTLMENDRYIREATGIENTGRYVLVRAASEQELLKRQEKVHDRLNRLKSRDAIGGFWGPGQFLPGVRRQKQNERLVRNTLLSRSEQLRSMLVEVGFKPEIIDDLFATLREASESRDFLTPDEWLDHPASFGMRQLWLGSTDGHVSSLIILKNIRNEALIRNEFEEVEYAHYRNRRSAFRDVMRLYRVRSLKLASAAYALILLFLMVRYGIGLGFMMFLPAFLGGFITVSGLSLLGVSFNLMHVLAVLIILGMGIDYTIFLVEEGIHGYSIRPTMLALLLSAITTVLSFGCLAFSQAAVINSIGSVVFPGILLILVLSPIVCTEAHEQ